MPSQRTVKVIDVGAPMPLPRPAALEAAMTPQTVPFGTASEPLEVAVVDYGAPMPLQKSAALLVATGAAPIAPIQAPAYEGETALVALANLGAPMPKARVLMTNPPAETSDGHRLRADDDPGPGAQRALEMIIERETTASLPAPRPLSTLQDAPVQTASLGSPGTLGALQGMLENTWDAVTVGGPARRRQRASGPHRARSRRLLRAWRRSNSSPPISTTSPRFWSEPVAVLQPALLRNSTRPKATSTRPPNWAISPPASASSPTCRSAPTTASPRAR